MKRIMKMRKEFGGRKEVKKRGERNQIIKSPFLEKAGIVEATVEKA